MQLKRLKIFFNAALNILCPPVHGVSSVAVVEVLVIHPEGVSLAAESEGPVPCEPPVAGPVLHVHRQLVRSVVVDVGQRPHQDVPQPELSVKVPEADLATNHNSVSPHSDQSQLSIQYHLVVLPASHEVLVRLHVVPHLDIKM